LPAIGELYLRDAVHGPVARIVILRALADKELIGICLELYVVLAAALYHSRRALEAVLELIIKASACDAKKLSALQYR
jgi:hypothetical protein